tara:strand:+ start:651 stop:2153 length:1503 start_codon:yes stop_codon:yes gene_type:complete
MFFGKKERDLVKQVNDELSERIIGQPIAYYAISAEESNFNETYGEAVEKVSLPPIRVYAFVVVENEQTNEKFGYEYQTKLTVNFHRRRLVEDQNLYVRVGDFVQYGDEFYEIVRLYNDTRYLFGQVEHKFQVTADCVRARQGVFKVMPGLEREKEFEVDSGEETPRTAPFPPIAASYITVNAEAKLPNERVLKAGTGIEFDDTGPNGNLTVSATGLSADGPVGSVQFNAGAGDFGGDANLTFLTDSGPVGRLGIGTDDPTHELTVIGDISASANVLIGGDLTVKDLTVEGIAGGGSPFKVRDSIAVYNDADQIVASLGSSSFGDNSLSASFGGFVNLSASANVSASYFYGDARYLTGVTASAVNVADGPVGSLQFRVNTPVSGEISGSSNVLYNSANNSLTVDAGLVHNRTTVVTTHTASVDSYILGVTGVPTEILFDATAFAGGQVLVIKDESGAASSANTITLNASGSQTIDGEGAAYIESPYGSVLLYSNGTNWFIY